MTGRWRGPACGVLLLLAAPAGAAGQTRNCNLVQEADFTRLVNAQSETVIYFRDPVRLRCTGGVTLAADSAVINQTQAAFELIGSVVYRDSTRQLTSRWANYLGRLEQLLARGDVVLTDLQDGSVVTGQDLQYLRETPGRPASHVVVRGGRPRALIRDRRPSRPGGAPVVRPPGSDTVPPTEIVADRLEFVGDTLFLARGRVELERGATTGAADSARYSQPTERLALLGRAHVRDDRYRLEGERIDALTSGEELREVVAQERASLISEELTVRSRRLRIGFEAGALERLEAWDPDAARADSLGPLSERALALAQDFRLRADSIDAVADSGRLREVRAVGRAYGERRLDSLAVNVPALVARDWIQGDTIIGYFASLAADADSLAADPSPEGAVAPQAVEGDSTEVVLERVVVIGGAGPALSLYRTEPAQGAARGAVNFMKAARIILFMTEGEVARVEAEGPIDGVYLDPLQATRRAPAQPATTPVPTGSGGGP